MPRTLTQVRQFAEQYWLYNPHAEFHWTVEIGGEEWTVDYHPVPEWANKYRGVTPVHWYSLSAFQDLLGALYRREQTATNFGGNWSLPIEAVCQCFTVSPGAQPDTVADPKGVPAIATASGYQALTRAEIEGPPASKLYRALCKQTPRLASMQLGCIGLEHIRTVWTDTLSIQGDVIYRANTDSGDDPSLPFVIEAAVARLKDGQRQIWTGINFAPTYGDPFLNRWLLAPVQPEEPVLGLRGLLDAYDVRNDSQVVVFLHLVCPNVEHSEFSKTEINHLPFKQALGNLLDWLLQALRQACEEDELRLEQMVFQALDAILSELADNERFIFDQLLERLRTRLRQDATLAAWLTRPDAASRLQSYIAAYQAQHNPVLVPRYARPTVATVAIPLHPDRHFSVLVEHITSDLLALHQVNKLLYIQVRELEPVVIENGWLCRMDMALLQPPAGTGELRNCLERWAINTDLPILVLRNADEAGYSTVEQIRSWLQALNLDPNRVVDLGLGANVDSNLGAGSVRLVEMMPGELAAWVLARFEALGIATKAVPPDADIRQDIGQRFERLLLGHLWEGVSQHLEVSRLLSQLDQELRFTKIMSDEALDQCLKAKLGGEACTKSYALLLDEIVVEFFDSFMEKHGVTVQKMAQAHYAHTRSRSQT